MTAPTDMCTSFLSSVIVDFMETYPLVQLDFALTNHHSKLVDEGFDIAVRAAARLGDSSLVARTLGDLQLFLYASPRYIQKYGTPASLDELHKHRCVVFRAEDLTRTWALRGAGGDAGVSIHGQIGGDDFSFVRAIVASGGGIGLLPHINCASLEASGQLVRVLPEFQARGATLYVVYPSTRNVPARVTAFRDFVVDAYATWIAHRDRGTRDGSPQRGAGAAIAPSTAATATAPGSGTPRSASSRT